MMRERDQVTDVFRYEPNPRGNQHITFVVNPTRYLYCSEGGIFSTRVTPQTYYRGTKVAAGSIRFDKYNRNMKTQMSRLDDIEAQASLAGAHRSGLSESIPKVVASKADSTLKGRAMALLTLYVIVWYVASAVCNTSARKILTLYSPLPLWLSFIQIAITASILRVYLFSIKKTPPPPIPTQEARDVIFKLAFTYTVGFIFVNSGYLAVNVSLAETLRSAEPLFSVFFAKLMLKDEPVSMITILTLVPIVAGGVLSSGGDASFNLLGFVFVCISNICFALRSVYMKHLKPTYSGNAIQVFYEICKIGAIGVFFLSIMFEILILLMGDENQMTFALFPMLLAPGSSLASLEFLWILLVNAVTYAAYNQMSFLVLSMVTMVTHAVGNSLRRVFTIVASVYIFGNPISSQNALGIVLAVGGVIAYSISKARDEAKMSKVTN